MSRPSGKAQSVSKAKQRMKAPSPPEDAPEEPGDQRPASLGYVAEVVLTRDELDLDARAAQEAAIYDLVAQNFMAPVDGRDGPYRLRIDQDEHHLRFTLLLLSDPTVAVCSAYFPGLALHLLVRDYREVCTSYFESIKSAPIAMIETVDMARRALHNEGATFIEEALGCEMEIDRETARRLFILVVALLSRS